MSVASDINEILTCNADLLEAFRDKRVLVTGSSGLIGSMLIRTLYAADEAYGLHIELIAHARSEARVRSVLGELTDRISLIIADDFDFDTRCDCIFHTASPTASKYFVDRPVETIDTILTGTKKMLELAKAHQAVLVYLSSMEAYGVPYTDGELMTEDRIGVIRHLTARSCYPEGKRMSECLCAAYSHEYGVQTRIVRLAQTFGAGVPLTDNRVSMQFARSIVGNRDIVLHTEGRSTANFCYLSDAIAGILTIAVRGRSGEAYNVCNDSETRSIYETAKLAAEQVAHGAIGVVKDIPQHADFGYAPENTMRLSARKLRALGWEPKVDAREGYSRLAEYLKDNGED